MSNSLDDIKFSKLCNFDDLSIPLLAEFQNRLAGMVVPDTTNESQLQGTLKQNGFADWPSRDDSIYHLNGDRKNDNTVYDPTLLSASQTNFNLFDDAENDSGRWPPLIYGGSAAEVPLVNCNSFDGHSDNTQMHQSYGPQNQNSEGETEFRGRSRQVDLEMVLKAGDISSANRQRPKEASESSWDGNDQLENFGESLQEQLRTICEGMPDIEKFFITAPLKPRDRRIVHSHARMRDVNHMTLHDAGEQRILVSTAAIRSSFRETTVYKKSWNARPSLWKLDPLAVIMALPLYFGREQLYDTLHRLNLPFPESSCQIAYSRSRRMFLGVFSSTGDAATVLEDLPTKYRNYCGGTDPQLQIDVSYRYWNEDTRFSATFTGFGDEEKHWTGNILFLSGRDYRPAKRAKHPPLSYRPHISRSSSQSSMLRRSASRDAESSDNDGYDSGRSRSSAKRSRTQFEFDDASKRTQSVVSGYLNGLRSRDASSDSNATRRRLPRQIGGYPCDHSGCSKIFNTDGERRKHERSHISPEERPYACDHCEKKFNDTKDLNRHAIVHRRD